MLLSVAAGFAAAMALIAVIGAQNTFVLRQGLLRQHIRPVVLTCTLFDLLFIAVGVAGLGTWIGAHPATQQLLRTGGAAFLCGYAALAAVRALRPSALTTPERSTATLRATLLTCVGFTVLNPHVYLDTVLLLGTVAHQHRYPWLFGVGAASASVVWFTALGAGAHRLAPVLAKPAVWRVIDLLVAVTMLAMAGWLLAG